ncbi:hypothetical protein LAZ67_11003256 [Cordylochernes scorpioides]|uniref:Uncharacterized protein n=1 Tax=Cordylochernes scorpioides TaxID=51811 RepID=A0ABY6L380_9ARAC|nr:hypothetical protein LAZ67_11003256 [Cordylochernes scorpioides]
MYLKISKPNQKVERFKRHDKAKTYLQDDDVPIDDATTKPLFTLQEKDAKVLGNIFKTSMESLAEEACLINVSNDNNYKLLVIAPIGKELSSKYTPSIQPLLTINTNSGLFRFKRTPFGLTNSPFFQSVMDRELLGIIW